MDNDNIIMQFCFFRTKKSDSLVFFSSPLLWTGRFIDVGIRY